MPPVFASRRRFVVGHDLAVMDPVELCSVDTLESAG